MTLDPDAGPVCPPGYVPLERVTHWRDGVEFAGCPTGPGADLTPDEERAALESAGVPHPYHETEPDDPRWIVGVDALILARLAKWSATDAGRPGTSTLF